MTAAYLEAAQRISNGLAEQLEQDVQASEAYLCRRLGSNVRMVQEISEHVSSSGGKRLRPALVALSARACDANADQDRIAAIGACVEMIHTATLIHDDVIDHAETRRGKPTASTLFGNTASILTGDVLLAKAMEILAEDGDLRIIRTISKAVVELAEGEVAELEARGNFDLSREKHFEILRKKTASFLAACCEAGALLAYASEQHVAAFAEFGERIGMGFQIADDLLDFHRTQITGKPRAGDFREGQATLPLIYLRDRLNAEEDRFVRSKFGNGATEQEIEDVLDLLQAREACRLAQDEAANYANQAVESIGILQDSPAKDLLLLLPRLLTERSS